MGRRERERKKQNNRLLFAHRNFRSLFFFVLSSLGFFCYRTDVHFFCLFVCWIFFCFLVRSLDSIFRYARGRFRQRHRGGRCHLRRDAGLQFRPATAVHLRQDHQRSVVCCCMFLLSNRRISGTHTHTHPTIGRAKKKRKKKKPVSVCFFVIIVFRWIFVHDSRTTA